MDRLIKHSSALSNPEHDPSSLMLDSSCMNRNKDISSQSCIVINNLIFLEGDDYKYKLTGDDPAGMCEDVSGGVDSGLVEAEIDLDFAPENKRNSTIIKKVSFLGIFVIKTGRASGDKWKAMERFATLYN